MASLDYHLNPHFSIKECSSCGALYTRNCGCSKGSLEDKILVPVPDSSQQPPQNCATCGNPVDGLYCRSCAFVRKCLNEVESKVFLTWGFCDMPLCDNLTPLEAFKERSKTIVDSNNDSTSSDDDSPYGEDIDYVDASPLDAKIVSLEVLYYITDDHIEEKSSGSTTTHSVFSLSKYDSFIFDLSINPFPPADRSDFYHEEFADELARIISPPEYDCFYFKNEPELGNLTMDVVEDIFPIREPRVHVLNFYHPSPFPLDFSKLKTPFLTPASPLRAGGISSGWNFHVLNIKKRTKTRLKRTKPGMRLKRARKSEAKASRPDIMFAVYACARFHVTPKTSHLHAVKRIFRYLKGQPKLGLWYPRDSPFDLEAFSDSDYAGASLDRKSTTGGCQFLGKRLISWQCKKQTIVANSTTEAEYVAAANCCGQVLWVQNQMLDYGFNFMNTKIYIDNESTICIVKNPVFHSKTKHIEIRHHFIRDSYEKKLIQVIKIHTDHNVADLLTKAFDVSSGPIHLVTDETVIKEWEDRMERAATTASSLEAEQDSGNINKTQSMATLNESFPQGTDSGSGPRCQDTILGGTEAQIRFEVASKQSNDPHLSRVNTLGSGEDSMKLKELIEFCTKIV
ncbi:hypothetical protein Tco_0534185 [Tanacetum coccineum]